MTRRTNPLEERARELALAAGADPARVKGLAALWHCDDEDAGVYADRVGCNLFMDGNAWCATDRHFQDLQTSPAGFGATCLEAMAELAKELGYQPSKMRGNGKRMYAGLHAR